ncbi:MAG TPA: sugar ABC transporter permease [Phycisphaerae bacterium]|nr:sugar ABC transporter permease [Phycisphaerae bacterium]
MKRGVCQDRIGYLFLSPWLVGFLGLTLLPMIASLLLSFCRWKGLDLAELQWVGTENYAEAVRGIASGTRQDLGGGLPAGDVGDLDVYIALKNTFYYTFLAVPLGLCTSLALAMLLNQQLKGIGLFRTIFYMPHVIGGVATIMMWMWVFNPDFGLLNSALRAAAGPLIQWGVLPTDWQPPGWLYSEQWSKPALVIMSLWGAGGAMLIFLAALQNVPEQLYEAARIDGAGRIAQFRHVTLPQISPAVFFNLVMGIIGTFQVFNSAYIITGGSGSPGKSLLFYVLYLYAKAFVDFEMGYASALAWVLFVIILAFTMLVIRSSSLWVYYEGERK